MGYSSDSERPAKRYKRSQPFEQQPAVAHAAPSFAAQAIFGPWSLSANATFSSGSTLRQPWDSWQLPPGLPTTEIFHDLTQIESQQAWGTSVPASISASPVTKHELPSSTATSDLDPNHPPHKTCGSLSAAVPHSQPADAQVQSNDRNRSDLKAVAEVGRVSPFRDCLDSFGKFTSLEFRRPNGGFVNGYVKFRWLDNSSQRPMQSQPLSRRDSNSWGVVPSTGTIVGPTPAPITFGFTGYSPVTTDFATDLMVTPAGSDALSPVQSEFSSTFLTTPGTSPDVSPRTSSAVVSQSNPRMVPPHFGHQVKDDKMNRRFWDFYINNWCPGRSILEGTNLWLIDFAKMQGNDGVRSAIQCLAGVYIYDYVPQRGISKRINELFEVAEARLTELINDPMTLKSDRADELITIAVILSMQDIVLTERRLKKPYHPRWLSGFLESEHALQATDPGSRFWRTNNVQLTSLRVSQCIIVGRAVILAQPMLPLLASEDFDPQKEASRFGWLLYGTEQEMYEIHGGCGFSKKLLHVMSQITYCAARVQQEDASPFAPMTAQYLLEELQKMRQWSSARRESRGWESAKTGHQIIDWVRTLPDPYTIGTSDDMTDVTAEAWRIAAIIYLQCRALRLPRNHPEVMGNLTDLASCIRIMPTSGTHFTAQAPLFPVFLLAILSTDLRHKQVSRNWFDQVVQTPVRSSVPPLFNVVLRIWTWIDKELPVNVQQIPESIGARSPWWERLVARVQEKETETLCLT